MLSDKWETDCSIHPFAGGFRSPRRFTLKFLGEWSSGNHGKQGDFHAFALPYITVKDQAQNQSYRGIYSTCHRQYSLGVPFTQRFWDLAIRKGEFIKASSEAVSSTAGYIGMIYLTRPGMRLCRRSGT
jgi:hypothetical protein